MFRNVPETTEKWENLTQTRVHHVHQSLTSHSYDSSDCYGRNAGQKKAMQDQCQITTGCMQTWKLVSHPQNPIYIFTQIMEDLSKLHAVNPVKPWQNVVSALHCTPNKRQTMSGASFTAAATSCLAWSTHSAVITVKLVWKCVVQ